MAKKLRAANWGNIFLFALNIGYQINMHFSDFDPEKGWFIIDLIATFPFDVFVMLLVPEGQDGNQAVIRK